MFARMVAWPAAVSAEPQTVMIDLKAHRTASGLRGRKGVERLIGRTKGGLDTKLHARAEANGRPLHSFMTVGQIDDYTGAAALLVDLPRAQWPLGDRSYDADGLRDVLQAEDLQS